MTPSGLVIVLTCACCAPALAVALAAVSGGHACSQAPVQLELGPLSASNRYTVLCFGPAARIVPTLLCFVVTTTAVPLVAAALLLAPP